MPVRTSKSRCPPSRRSSTVPALKVALPAAAEKKINKMLIKLQKKELDANDAQYAITEINKKISALAVPDVD